MEGRVLIGAFVLGLFLFVVSPFTHSGSLIYTYDQKGRLISVEYPGNYRIEYSYDPAGNRTQKLISISTPSPDFDDDHDVDGLDLHQFIGEWGNTNIDLPTFARQFGTIQGEEAGS